MTHRTKTYLGFFCILITCFFYSPAALSQSPNQLLLAVGASGNDAGNSIIQTTDGGFAITGSSACISCPADASVFKLDSAYSLKWSIDIGGNNVDYGNSIIETESKDLVAVGSTSSFGSNGIYIIKLNSSGTLLWSKSITGNTCYSIVQSADGGYTLAGYTSSCRSCPAGILIIHTDSAANIQWSETIGGTSNDTAYSIIQTSDKGYAIAGATTSFGAGGTDVYVVKLDSAGNIKWTRTIGGTGNEAAYSITQTKDGGYGVSGTTNSFGSGGYDMYVIKLDSTGQVNWTRTVGSSNNEVAKSIITTADSGLIVAGTVITSTPNEKVCVFKLSSSGKLDWVSTVSGDSSSANSIIQTKSGGFVVTGATSYFGSGESDVYIMLFDSIGRTCVSHSPGESISSSDSGRVNTGGTANSFSPTVTTDASTTGIGGVSILYCSTAPTSLTTITRNLNKLTVFPNPTTDNITLQYYSMQSTNSTISIIDITGQTIFTESHYFDIGNNTYTLPATTIASGIYFVKLSDVTGISYTKFIKSLP